MSGTVDSGPIPKMPRLHRRGLRVLGGTATSTFPFSARRQCSFTFARNALLASLRAMGVRPDEEILVPAYHCVTVVAPVLCSGAKCRFYGIDRQLRADITSLLDAMSDRTRAVVVIHFFGFPQPLDEIKDVCASRRVALIEDCTHALYSTYNGRHLGTQGDLALFSLRKTLPLLGGALLVGNNEAIPLPAADRRPPWSYSLRCFKYVLETGLGRAVPEGTEVPVDGGPGPREGTIPRGSSGPTGSIDGWLYGYDVNLDLNDRRDSALSAWLARHCDPVVVCRRRRENYQRLASLLSDVTAIRVPLPELPVGVCPWSFCVDAMGLAGLDRRLRRLGVPAFTFGEVLHRALPAGAFPDAEYLSANLVQLPIHQDVSEQHVERIAARVREAISTP